MSEAEGKVRSTVQSSHSRRGARDWIIRFLLILLVLLVIPIPVGMVWQFLAQRSEARTVLPPGQLTNVDDRFLHLYCTG